MSLEQIIAMLTPIAAGASGILFSLIVFVSRIAALRREVKAQLTDNETIRKELTNTRQALSDLKMQVNYVVEAVKDVNKSNK
jgi:uncharacterized coiled-coil protein SlyX